VDSDNEFDDEDYNASMSPEDDYIGVVEQAVAVRLQAQWRRRLTQRALQRTHGTAGRAVVVVSEPLPKKTPATARCSQQMPMSGTFKVSDLIRQRILTCPGLIAQAMS